MKQFRRVRDIIVVTRRAIDGQVGSVRELYFDDQNWKVRYLIVKTGDWLFERDVLIARGRTTGFACSHAAESFR